jgi:SAM-dependent methyltransferase
MYPSHDPDVLRQQYGSDALLRLRQETHDRYSVPRVDFPEWVLSRIHWRGNERVVDVGTGTGSYYSRLHDHYPELDYIGMDLSLGMLETHALRAGTKKSGLVVGDAQKMPFESGIFDAVMANHMLYHVPDLDGTILEFKRILRPGGLLITATNSVGTMPELNFLYQRALIMLSNSGSVPTPLPIHNAYSLESGTRLLARHFYSVVRHDLPTSLVFPHADPLMEYMESIRQLREPSLPEGVYWDDVMLVMREQANRVIAALGELVIQKVSGVLIASDTGGIVRDFVNHLGD